MTLQRLVITYTPDGIQLRTLYRRADGPRPGTVRRRREVEQLARDGLTAALEALDNSTPGDVADLGTSGFQVREDVLGLETPCREGNPMEASSFLPTRSNNVRQRRGG